MTKPFLFVSCMLLAFFSSAQNTILLNTGAYGSQFRNSHVQPSTVPSPLSPGAFLGFSVDDPVGKRVVVEMGMDFVYQTVRIENENIYRSQLLLPFAHVRLYYGKFYYSVGMEAHINMQMREKPFGQTDWHKPQFWRIANFGPSAAFGYHLLEDVALYVRAYHSILDHFDNSASRLFIATLELGVKVPVRKGVQPR